MTVMLFHSHKLVLLGLFISTNLELWIYGYQRHNFSIKFHENQSIVSQIGKAPTFSHCHIYILCTVDETNILYRLVCNP